MNHFLWLIFSYLLGSLPFGYLISRISGKNILEIGWRKTSGSNVFYNVGKWQGILTGVLDAGKGYLAVFGAQKFGLPLPFQIYSGVAAVIGHNWSIFLKFAGGRGIGTLLGAFLRISPKILGFSIIPFVLLALIWNAPIGTLLFLATAIFLAVYLKQFETAGIFTTASLAPILIKRLSPLKEIPKAESPRSLFWNRLIFDNDSPLWDLRFKRILKKNSGKLFSLGQKISAPLLVPPKIGWKAAKFGVNIVAKPIAKLISLGAEKVVTEIGVGDFQKMMLASAKKIVAYQEEINKINVWPVADKDTGYNLAATLLGIEGVINQREYSSFLELAEDIKEASMINARGNAGMIFTGYLIKFLDQIKNLKILDGFKLALAMKKGIKAAYLSIVNPVEGTILDTIKATGEKAFETAVIKKEKNIIKILEEVQKTNQKALAETKEKLEVLRQNDVVDAGAFGFVKILEAWLESLKGTAVIAENGVKPVILEKPEESLEYQYEIVFRLKKPPEPLLKELKNELSLLGGSIDIVASENEIKFHIHANSPEKVRQKLKNLEILDWRAENLITSVKKSSERKPLGLIVGETADLPREFLEENRIAEIPFIVRFPDGEIPRQENLFQKIKEAKMSGRPLPVSSVPAFQDFLSAYQKNLGQFEEVLVLTLSSKLSGTYSAARIARSMLKEKQRITVFDCFSAEVGEGLTAFKVQELILQGKSRNEILRVLKNFCPRVKVIGILKDFNYFARSGRFYLPKTLFKILSVLPKIGIHFLFGIKKGKVRFLGLRLGKDQSRILAEEIEKEKGKVNLAIAYGDNEKEALELKKELEKKEKAKVLFVSPVSMVIGLYTGPEILIVGICPA